MHYFSMRDSYSNADIININTLNQKNACNANIIIFIYDTFSPNNSFVFIIK